MLYATAYGVRHCKRELCVSGWFHFNQQLQNTTNNIKWNHPLTHSSLLQWRTPYAVVYNVYNLYSWRWTYRCPKHVELFMIINKFFHQIGTFRHSWYYVNRKLSWGLSTLAKAKVSPVQSSRNIPTDSKCLGNTPHHRVVWFIRGSHHDA